MPAPEITVVQLNLYRMRWRWRERARLVLDELQQLEPDVVTLQEVAPFRCQAQWLARQVNRRLPGHRYRAYVSRKQGWRGLLEGVAVLSRLPVRRFASHPIGDTRVAQRIVLRVADRDITLINTHLSAGGDARETRIAQAHHIVARLPAGRVPLVVAGDLNAQPQSRTLAVFAERGLRSACSLANGHEPARTVPSFEAARPSYVLDYILVSDAFEVVSADVAFTNPSPCDPGLFASDHFGLVARLRLRD